jgi:outer membrane protein TolC
VAVPPTVSNLVACARLANPGLRARAARVEAADGDAAAVDGFYSTALSAASGFADGPLRTPGSLLPGVAPTESWVAEASVARPLRSGLRLRGSLARWDSLNGGAAEPSSASVAGCSVEKPLLRDRGFATQRLDAEAAALGADQARAWQAAAWQETCHAVTRGYADWLAAHAEIAESLSASGRVARLLEETEARVALEATPAYQLASARMEVAFRQDELHQARAALQDSRSRLEELVGVALTDDLLPAPSPDELRRWAETCASAGLATPFALAIPDRPEWRAAAAAAAQADTRVRRAREDLKSDLSLVAGVGMRLNNAPGAHADADLAWEAGVVWRSPLGFEAERARAAARAADARAARADLAAIANAAAGEYARAQAGFAAVCARLESVDRAVEAARASLDAEADRFRLGEGRSRLVLDAQKDLSAANRRANAAAVETIRAFTDLVRAAGVPFAPLYADSEPREAP